VYSSSLANIISSGATWIQMASNSTVFFNAQQNAATFQASGLSYTAGGSTTPSSVNGAINFTPIS
jgi:hypothetical protein